MNTLVYFDFDHMNSIACSVRNLNLQPRQANESFYLVSRVQIETQKSGNKYKNIIFQEVEQDSKGQLCMQSKKSHH